MSRTSPPMDAAPGPDVRQLSPDTLSAMAFPASRTAAFRVHFDPTAYAAMLAHASEDVTFEICGVLVGDWGHDHDGPFATVRHYVRCDDATKRFAEVTFTHESWSHINQQMDTKFQDQKIVGWYHSHPNFGIFLSDRDLFIQQNFFSSPGQIALVIDPVRKIEGVFEWRSGQVAETTHYWVGDRIQVRQLGTGVPELSGASGHEMPEVEKLSASDTKDGFWQSSKTLLTGLAGLSLFLMGWLLANWRSDAEHRALVFGTVAHFGNWKVWKPDLDLELGAVEQVLDEVNGKVKMLAADHVRLAEKNAGEKDQTKTTNQILLDWKKTLEASLAARRHLRHVKTLYAMSPEERQAYQRFMELTNIELMKGRSSTEKSAASGPTEGTESSDPPRSKENSSDGQLPKDRPSPDPQGRLLNEQAKPEKPSSGKR